MAQKLFAVDAFAHIYQFFYAIKGLTGPDGEPVNAVYGFARMMQQIVRGYRPDYLVVAWDGRGELERKKLYSEYKANRKPMPAALVRQIPVIEQLLDVLHVPVLSAEGQEADDVLATLARRADEQGIQTVIVTTDKDAEQLIDESTRVLHIHKDGEAMLDAAALKEAKGLTPEQVVDMLSLAGDSSDNVPGVPGVGPKTALGLIQQFGSVEGLYDHLDQVESEKMRRKLADHREDVRTAAVLVTLNRQVPLDIDWESCRVGGAEPEEVRSFYSALGFRSLLEETQEAPAAPAKGTAQGSLFETRTSEPQLATIATVRKDYSTVSDLDALRALVAEMERQDEIAIDTETTSLEPRRARLVGMSFSWRPDQGVYVALGGPKGSTLCPVEQAVALLKPLLEAEGPRKTGQNLKYDISVLKNYGVEVSGLSGDSMVASYLLHPSSRSHGLDALSRRHLGYSPVPIEELIGKGPQQLTMDRVPVEKVSPYSCEDADLALQLSRKLADELKHEDLHDLFAQLELPLVPVLADMEWQGIRVDAEQLRALSAEFAEKLSELERMVYKEAGGEFNINSPQQVSTVLFEKLKLPAPRGRRTTLGYSTAVSVLEDLRKEHPVVDYMLQYRELSKLKSTYADALLAMINPDTGRVHCSFNQTVTATGRLSSSDPNLQNIPVRTPLGRRIRSAFVPGGPGMSLLDADYSQVELRIMAHCSGDPALSRAFLEGRDIHRFVAAQVNGVEEDQVSPQMRQRAKAVNFGIIYGLSPYGLSRQIDIPVEEAERFIDDYFRRYPRVKEFIGKTIDRARQFGYAKTLAGRKRRIEGLRSTGATRSAAERIAVNTVIQGTAADLIKRAMIDIHRGLPAVSARARMLVQIHDELLFEVPDEEMEQVCHFVTEKMTGALKLDVPLKVDTAVGANWAETK
jgi:DNA polymerase-1